MSAAENLPVLAVCGWSGSGKTTLLEGLIPRLRELGLRVAVVKNDAHGIAVDRSGKDSDRLFRAGASVVLGSSDESFARWPGGVAPGLSESLRHLAVRNDAVLVEGHKATRLKKLWLLSEDESEPPDGVDEIVRVLPRNEDRLENATGAVLERLDTAWRSRPILGGVLLGGQSQRMGEAKQLIRCAGRTIIERTCAALEDQVDEVVLLGDGEVPAALKGLRSLPDPPSVEGPMAGLVAALRWAPHAAWVIAACDLPLLTGSGVRWLLGERRPGRWAILPRTPSGRVDPLLAVYEPHALPLLEQLIADGTPAPRRLAGSKKVVSPTPPEELARQWRGVNTPGEHEDVCAENEELRSP